MFYVFWVLGVIAHLSVGLGFAVTVFEKGSPCKSLPFNILFGTLVLVGWPFVLLIQLGMAISTFLRSLS